VKRRAAPAARCFLVPIFFTSASNLKEEFFAHPDDLQGLPENTWIGDDDPLLNRFF
jgi:hypothetical protein